MAQETGEIFESSENVVDGTPCSYENSHAICIQVSDSKSHHFCFYNFDRLTSNRASVRLWVVTKDLAHLQWKTSAVFVTESRANVLWQVDITAEPPDPVKH